MNPEEDGLCDYDKGLTCFFRFGGRFALVGLSTDARHARTWDLDAARLSTLAVIGPRTVLKESNDDAFTEAHKLADEALNLMEKYITLFPESFRAEYFEILEDTDYESEFEPLD